jgi:microcystin-dependent protein
MKARLLIFSTLFFLFTNTTKGQVGIGTTNPDNSSILDVESVEKGILIPRMTALERIGITSPAEGLMVYQTDDVKGFYFYDGTSWDRMLKESKDPVPTGAIISFPLATPPTGYMVCDGSAVSRTTYAELFALLGTTYGAGDGTTTFNLPDYRGKFLRGHDDGAGNDPDAATRQDRGDGTVGDNVGTLQDGDMASHLHQIDPPSTTTTSAGSHNHNTPNTFITSGTSGNHTHSTTPRNINTNPGGTHRHQIRGEDINVSTTTFGSSDFLVENPGVNGPDYRWSAMDGEHLHSITIPSLSMNSNGNHSHSINIPVLTTNTGGFHNHSINISAFDSATTGSSENRPLNITVVYCIKY